MTQPHKKDTVDISKVHSLRYTTHTNLHTHSSGEPGGQGHLQVPLQAQQSRHQDEQLVDSHIH